MKTANLKYAGMKQDRNGVMAPHFTKKDGGEWSMPSGGADFSAYKVGEYLKVTWDENMSPWTIKSVEKGGEPRRGGFGGRGPGIEASITGLLKSAIEAGKVNPLDGQQMGQAAVIAAQALRAGVTAWQATAEKPPVAAPQDASRQYEAEAKADAQSEAQVPAFDDDIPF